ncbi:lysophospholipid acyltransferase family protein [Salipaludibacillus daqingensis]|uniref:lysophospholipid acyltransferase family protein n=1 Tax=Salipaludibacillus daqingensis TaxID=3041001 RepID=UPI002476F974|nr:lysophospholipid acyltransferase family protein [Salipaludibacillus daqingensis]
MVYKIIFFIIHCLSHVRYRLKVRGVENIPEGSVIIAMNHQAAWDPLLVGTHTPRKLHIMAKESLFANKWLGWIITEMGAFPVNREKADVKSLRHSLKLLKEGHIFSLFIEGSRSLTNDMQQPKKGVGFIVSKSGAPVVPTFIDGTSNKKWFSKATVTFGKPISFEGEKDYEVISQTIAKKITDIKNRQ